MPGLGDRIEVKFRNGKVLRGILKRFKISTIIIFSDNKDVEVYPFSEDVEYLKTLDEALHNPSSRFTGEE